MPETTRHQDIRAIAIGALLIVLVGVFFIGQSLLNDDAEEEAALEAQEALAKNTPTIQAEDLRDRLAKQEGITLIDVRSPESYATEHLRHARLMSGTALESFTPENNNPVVIIDSREDKAGSLMAKDIASKKPYTYYFLEGSFEGWKERGFPTISAGDPNSFQDQSKVTFVDAGQTKVFLEPQNNIFLLDVQSADAFAKKHIKGALNIPLAELEARANELPPARQIIVYGENELASFQGAVRLFDLNFFAVRALSGNNHLSGESGLPLEP